MPSVYPVLSSVSNQISPRTPEVWSSVNDDGIWLGANIQLPPKGINIRGLNSPTLHRGLFLFFFFLSWFLILSRCMQSGLSSKLLCSSSRRKWCKYEYPRDVGMLPSLGEEQVTYPPFLQQYCLVHYYWVQIWASVSQIVAVLAGRSSAPGVFRLLLAGRFRPVRKAPWRLWSGVGKVPVEFRWWPRDPFGRGVWFLEGYREAWVRSSARFRWKIRQRAGAER